MSEEQEINEVELETANTDQDDNLSDDEVRAMEKGWKPLEDWEKDGKNADDWVTAKHFNERGDWIAERRSMNDKIRNVDERIANNNKMWQVTLDNQINQLKKDRRKAIEDGYADEVEDLDKQIDEKQAQKQQFQQPVVNQPAPEDTQHENEWAQANASWYQSNTEKGQFARQAVNTLVSQGYSGKALTDKLESMVNAKFSRETQNLNRNRAVTDKDIPAPTGKGKKITSLSQLTGENAQIAQMLKNHGMSDKKIIQTINDKGL